MKHLTVYLLVLLFPIAAMAQQASHLELDIPRAATVNMSAPTNDWNVYVRHIEAPAPGSNSVRSQLRRKKQLVAAQYPTNKNQKAASTAEAPTVGSNFEGNLFQGIPNDNDLAISNNGTIVSVTNSRIHIFNGETGEELAERSLSNIASPLSVAGNKYDPKVVYDPQADRFIIIFLNGSTWQTSRIIVAFSQTSDPTGEWNLYDLPGNPLENDTWSDYPVIGISEKDLYIGINTFTNGSQNNSGFIESNFWQIGLKQGYVGFDLETRYYHDILPQGRPIFNITPIPEAAGNGGENMFLLSNRNTDISNDTLFLMEVTGRVSDPATELLVRSVVADQPYVLPVPAKQTNGQYFDTNDSRVLGGYTLNDQLYFVQSCTDPATGTSGIYLGVIDGFEGASPAVISRIFSEPELYYGYPNISWAGATEDDATAIISFNHSSETVNAGMSALLMNSDLEASERVEIKSGLNGVNVMSDTLERWGDYSGAQRLYSLPGVVWAAGSFGNSAGGHGTWISEILIPGLSTSITETAAEQVPNTVFPNPVAELITVEFEMPKTAMTRLELLDVQGRVVQLLLHDRLKKGANLLRFSIPGLSSGTYFIRATDEESTLFSRKIMKE